VLDRCDRGVEAPSVVEAPSMGTHAVGETTPRGATAD